MITLYLRRVNGKGDRLHIHPQAKTQELIESIRKTLAPSIGEVQIEAYFKGDKLNDNPNQSLADSSIANNSIIHVVEKEVEEKDENELVTIKLVLQDRLLQYQIEREENIGTLKQIICEDLDIRNEDDLTLTYLGLELQNGKSAGDYNFSKEVLISGSVSFTLNNLLHRKGYNLEKESCSQQSQGIPKIVRQGLNSPKKRVKKAQSLNVDSNPDLSKPKNVFASVQLNRIDEKIEQSKNQSQINESEEMSEQKSEQQTQNYPKPEVIDWQKPKFTLQSLSKPCLGSQQIIQTESIVDDEEEEPLLECSLELIRSDHMRQYVFDCRKEDTFQDAVAMLAQLQKTEIMKIRLLINFEDLSRSSISSQGSKGMMANATFSPKLKRQRSSCALESKQLLQTMQNKFNGLKMAIVDYASRLKKKELSFQYQIFIQI